MEASALHAPPGRTRVRSSAGAPFLRLRSDEQLVELFRAGHEDAFRVIHDRYRTRLFAYTRQMLPGSRQDAEDALQDVFIRAYSGLRANDRQLALRAWLYRVAHNRCVDQLRKNAPLPTDEIELTSQDVSTDPMAAVQQREDLRKLVDDVQRLPEQQRSALLMREMSGMSYQELAESLDLSVPAIKSLLVRARVGLTAAAEARDTDCGQIREEIVDSHERGARPNALTRRHLTDCVACRDYRESVRGVSKSFAALVPAGPLVLAVKFLGIGSVYHAAAYSGGAGGTAAATAAASGAAAVGAGGAAAGGAAAASGAAAGSAAAVGAGGAAAASGAGAVATGGAIAGGVTATHIVALAAVAAMTGGAVAVSATSPSSHHHGAAVHPAANVIAHAVRSGVAEGYSPAAAVAPVAPVSAAPQATPRTPAVSHATSTPVISKLKQTTHPTSAISTGGTTTAATSPGAVTPVNTTTTPTPAGATTTTPGATTTTPAGESTTTTTPATTSTTGGTATTGAAQSVTTAAPTSTTASGGSDSETTPARNDTTSGDATTTVTTSTSPTS